MDNRGDFGTHHHSVGITRLWGGCKGIWDHSATTPRSSRSLAHFDRWTASAVCILSPRCSTERSHAGADASRLESYRDISKKIRPSHLHSHTQAHFGGRLRRRGDRDKRADVSSWHIATKSGTHDLAEFASAFGIMRKQNFCSLQVLLAARHHQSRSWCTASPARVCRRRPRTLATSSCSLPCLSPEHRS